MDRGDKDGGKCPAKNSECHSVHQGRGIDYSGEINKMEIWHIRGKADKVHAIRAIYKKEKNRKTGKEKVSQTITIVLYSLTWKTVRQDCPKLLKVPRDSSFLNRPPKICIPSRAKMNIKRMRRTSRALMDAMELTKLLTRLPMEAQYLEAKS